ncbi:MAG: radical SAM protein [Deltaproteobacteria bacterium]|nr:radical SAM protein [Deltaproteobacteria bacterium]MBN2686794.1 radical SAM protein [Deltaproteobacteria bacterium]
MKYEGMIIRPPSEAGSLLLQVTVGCSHNKCSFCGTYRDVRFRIKSFQEIEEDIVEAAGYGRIKRVFLCDGDALMLPQKKLVPIFESIRENIRGVERIGLYGNAKSIMRKAPDELRQLRELGLGIVYLGVETGNGEILRKINKGVDYETMVKAGRRIKEAGITLSCTVLLGIGGTEMSAVHAMDTARILTDIDPDYVGALTVMLIPGTPLHDDYIAGRFKLPDTFGYLEELGIMVAHSDFTDCFFTSNHASNYLPIRARMPGQKDEIVHLIHRVITSNDRRILRPEFMRAL